MEDPEEPGKYVQNVTHSSSVSYGIVSPYLQGSRTEGQLLSFHMKGLTDVNKLEGTEQLQ